LIQKEIGSGLTLKGSIKLTMDFSSQKSAKDALLAMKKEVGESKRFSSKIKIEGKKMIIMINGEDPVSLRATVNSYLRYLSLVNDLEK